MSGYLCAMRGLTAYILSLALTLTSFALAEARGASHDIGAGIVICSGVGMKTITIGPDGTPTQSVEVCPDGYSVLSESLAAPHVDAPALRFLGAVAPLVQTALMSRSELVPSARGPPAFS